MLIEGVGGLSAEVAVLEVEIQRADAVRTVDAGELRAALDPMGGVVSHNLIVSRRKKGNGALWSRGESNGLTLACLAALPTGRCVILTTMDHLAVLREKIERLRSEIADIQELNEQYRFRTQKGAEADIAHSNRQERLQEIQEELVQLSQLARKTLAIEQMREKHRSRLHLVKNAS